MAADERFSATFLALLVELWHELDRLLAFADDEESRLAVAVEILRLELSLLDSSCHRLLERGELTHAQALRVRVLLDDVRYLVSAPEVAALALAPLEHAQDRLYEEMRGVLATGASGPERIH